MAPESQEEHDTRMLEELKGKNVAHYSVMLGAWLQTKMEYDKTLVTLSFGGIALLVTVINLTGWWSVWSVLLFTAAFSGFLMTIGCALVIYERNAAHIESEIRGHHKDFKLARLDKFLKYAFLFGAICAILGSTISIGRKQMAESTTKTTTPTQNLNESLKGIDNLAPTEHLRSLSGIENLKPPAVTPAPPAQSPSSTAQPQAPSPSQAPTDKATK